MLNKIQNVATQAGQPTSKANPTIFYGFIGLALVVVVLEQIFLSGLRGNLLILTLVSLTTFLGLGTVGLWLSGLWAQLPRSAKIGLSLLLVGIVVLDFIVFLLPVFLSGSTANDAPVKFAITAPAQAADESTLLVNPLAVSSQL